MGQDVISAHYQNAVPEIFDGLETRVHALLRLARKDLKDRLPLSLLNIGAGNGYLEYEAQKRGFKVSSIDPDAATCERLKAKGVDAHVGLIEQVPMSSASCDVVIATEVLEHLALDTMKAGLTEISRVLKPGGRFIGTVPYQENLAHGQVMCPDCRRPFHTRGHQQSFSASSLRIKLADHFHVIICKPVLYPPWTVLNWKGRIISSIQLTLSMVGFHGSTSNLMFVCRKGH